MKINRRQFGDYALYLALLGTLGAVVLYAVQGGFTWPVQISALLAVIGLVVFVILNPRRLRQAFQGRQMRYGSNASLMIIATLGILVVVNYLVFLNPQRWDLTEDREHTLAPETLDTLNSLPEPVTAVAFFTKRSQADLDQADRAQTLLEDFKFAGDGRFDYLFVDPDEDPVRAQAAGITRDDTIVLEMGDRDEQVTFLSERELTAGLIRLMTPGQRVVYFLTGHGERDPEGVDDAGMGQVSSILQTKNYLIQPLNLLGTIGVPEDAAVVVIAGPQQPVSSEEVDALGQYLEAGGALILLQEPTPVTEFGELPDPLADYLFQTWGVEIGNDLIVDLVSNQPFVAVSNPGLYGNNLITQRLQGLFTLFPSARSVRASRAVQGVSQVELVLTADQSWAETNLASLTNQQELSPDEGQDLIGPVPLAVVGENFATDARVVVIGDSDFATNAFISAYGNSDLMVNAVDWATAQDDLISLTPREATTRVLLPPTENTLIVILLGSLFLIPGSVIVAGVAVWARRRRRG